MAMRDILRIFVLKLKTTMTLMGFLCTKNGTDVIFRTGVANEKNAPKISVKI